MTTNHFNHIDLRVSNISDAMRFHAALPPELGFTRERHGAEWKVFSSEGGFVAVPYFGFTEQPDHRTPMTAVVSGGR